MHSNDQTKGGYAVFRDHETQVQVDFRAINNGMQMDLQSDIGETTPINVGDWAGWIFWDFNPENTSAPITGESPTNTVNADENVEGTSRFVCPQESDVSGNVSQVTAQTPRLSGSWMQCTACIMTDIGLLPINSKSGEPDTRYRAKQPILEASTDDDFNIFRPLSQKVPAPGSTGILMQCANQDRYELVFFEINDNGGILVDHKSDRGLSTNVFDINTDGTIDTANKHAAAIDSIFRVIRDENNAKVVAINGTRSGKDTTGFLPVFMQFETTQKAVYLSHEKGGPLHPGTNTDNRVINPNQDNLFLGGAHLDTNASFFQSQERHGKIDFKAKNFPQDIEELENVVESELVLDQENKCWRIITDVGQNLAIAEGVIRWNFVEGVDLSEGQLILPLAEGETEGPPVLVWIDYNQSQAVQFSTMGDGCIFELKLIGEATRLGETRPLYRATRCKVDGGREFTHFERDQFTIMEYVCFADDDEVGRDPWQIQNESQITTTIAGNPEVNRVLVELTDTYDIENENYRWLSLASMERGLNFIGAPICPTPIAGFGTEHFKMESNERFEDGESIARYELNKQIEVVT